jgi:hypothetical protein
MKIAFINFCPSIQIHNDKNEKNHNDKNSSSRIIINKLKEKLIQNKHIINEINVHEMTINACLGCTEDVLFQPKPYCEQDDDMNAVYPILRESDIWIFAVKQNHSNIPDHFHNFLDRLEPLFNEFSGNAENDLLNLSFTEQGRVFLMAFSEHFGKEVFNELSYQIQSTAFLFRKNYYGEFLRPHLSFFIDKYLKDNDFSSEVDKQINELAQDLLAYNSIANGYLDSLSQAVVSKQEYESFLANTLSKIIH